MLMDKAKLRCLRPCYKMVGMYNNKPYFKQMDVKGKGLYLSYYELGFYGVCKELGGGHYLKCAEKTNWLSPSSCWQYYNGKIMTNDEDLKVQAVSSVVPCGNITIKLEGQAKICQKNVEGEYVPTGQYSAGRIVFKHSQRDLYLHCRPGYNEWYVTPELQSGITLELKVHQSDHYALLIFAIISIPKQD